MIQHRAGVKHGNCDPLSRVNRPCTSCVQCERREEEEREANLKDSETCQCSNLNEANQSNQENNDQGGIIQKNSKDYEGMEKVSIVKSKEKGGSASKRDPTEWELQKHTNAESIRHLGYLHDGLPSQDVKSEDSTAENSNSSKCEKDRVQSEYVRDIHCSAGNNMDSSDECILDQENLRQAQFLDHGMSVLYKGMEQNKRPTWDEIFHTNDEIKTYWAQWSQIVLHNGVLRRKYFDTKTDTHSLQIILPKSLREKVLTQLHDHATAGHLGSKKNIEKVKQ